jgi:glucose/arabinose dehydrogenase
MLRSAIRVAKTVNSPRFTLLAFGTCLLAIVTGVLLPKGNHLAHAQAAGPTMLHPNLGVRTVASGFTQPIAMAFLAGADAFVLEKGSGRVLHFANAAFRGVALDLSVNAGSERGLLGIALHPRFPADPGVYLYWTCRSTVPPDTDPFTPEQISCPDPASTLPDTENLAEVPLLGNRVDRFVWNGSTLRFDRNLITLLAFQHDGAPNPPGQGDSAQPIRGNHDGGVLAFGPDGKLYVMVGDLGRRGALQNLPSGPTPGGGPDDQFGGPNPDNPHFSGVILRLNDDGSAPTDNPFFNLGRALGGEIGPNVERIFAYGIRNSFGMAFDPLSGDLWQQENGEDAYDELNRVEAGMNSGWIQIAGPASRVGEYRQIETTALHHEDFPNLQQFRWPPDRIATTPSEALGRLLTIPGSHYSDPEFSWKHVLAPSAIGFVNSRALGREFLGDLFVGFAVPEPLGGPLFRFQLTGNRARIAVDDPRLEDRVADNTTFHDMTESESLLVGRDFGIVTDIKTGPNGNVFLISLSNGAIYEIFRR